MRTERVIAIVMACAAGFELRGGDWLLGAVMLLLAILLVDTTIEARLRAED